MNNAGVMGMVGKVTTSKGLEIHLAVNYLGHFYLTHLLLRLLKLSDRPRICNLSSMAYSKIVHNRRKVVLDLDNINWQNPLLPYDDDMAYSRSKLAIVLSTLQLAEKLKQQYPSFRVASVHPGAVRTSLSRSHRLTHGILNLVYIVLFPFYWLATKDASEGSQTSLHIIFEETAKLKSGGYYSDCECQPIESESNTPETREQLWRWTCNQLGINKDFAKAH